MDLDEEQQLPPSFVADLPPSFVPDSASVNKNNGLIKEGNIDLYNRPKVKNPDGSISTVKSMSFNEDGKEILVPTVSDDGKIVSDQDAINNYHKTGKHLGIFDTPENATKYAQQLHTDYANGKYDRVTGNSDDIDSGADLPKHLSFLDSFSSHAKDFLKNHPIIEKAFQPLADVSPDMKKAQDSFSEEHPIVGKGLKLGTDLITSLSSPATLGLTALSGGSALAEKAGMSGLADALEVPAKVASGGMVAHGGYNAATGKDAGTRIGGLIEGGLGAFGLRGSPHPKIDIDPASSIKPFGPTEPIDTSILNSRPDLAPVGGEADFNAFRPKPEPVKTPEQVAYEATLNKGNGPENINDIAGKLTPDERAGMRDSDSAATASRPSLMEPHSLMGQVPSEFSTMADEDVSKSLAPKSEVPSNTQLENEPKSLLEAQIQGEEAKPPLDAISNAPQRAEKPEDVLLPAPGQATPRKDINNFRASFGSADRTLMSRPESKGVVSPIIEAQDSKMSFIASTERQLADVTKGLSKQDRLLLSDGIEGKIEGEVPPNLIPRIKQAREILDHAFGLITDFSGKDINYQENYLTHIEGIKDADLKSGISSIFDYHLGEHNPLSAISGLFERGEYQSPTRLTKGGDAAVFDKGLGNPDSPFREERLDKITNLERDPNKLFPAYIESIAKLIYDAPAVEKAKLALRNIPETNIDGSANKLKDLAKAYIKNYTRYDSLPGLNQAWGDFANSMNRTTSRSMLGFSTGLQSLHAARIAGNLWPELGTKYTSYGLSQVVRNPIQAYGEATRLGLLQGQVRPFAFQTKMERFDAISNFLGAADFLDKAIGYHGFKRMYLDAGMSEGQASLKALAATKKASLTSDAARPIMAFNGKGPEGAAFKMAGLYKTVPIKMVEQYMDITRNVFKNPKAAARMVTGVSLLVAGAAEGAHVFHLNPSQFALQMGGAFGSVMGKIANDLYIKKDWQQAVIDTALWATPGGMSIKRQIENGPSAINSPSGKKPAKLKFIS